MTLPIDTVDADLYPGYVTEANVILDNLLEYYSPQAEIQREKQSIHGLEAFEDFLPLSTLEKIHAHLNKVPLTRMHVLAASHDTSGSIIIAPENKTFSFRKESRGSIIRKFGVLYLERKQKERNLNKVNAGD